jgi:non-homologous end joining protein Ku
MKWQKRQDFNPSLNEDDMKQYLQQIIEEVKKTKNQSTEAS